MSILDPKRITRYNELKAYTKEELLQKARILFRGVTNLTSKESKRDIITAILDVELPVRKGGK